MAADQSKALREHSDPSKRGWSKWKKAMVPLERGFEHRGETNQVGLTCSSIRTTFRDQAQRCGIYEWAVKGTLRGQSKKKVVVYVGSTCRGKPGVLRDRILEYCTNRSHKKDLINDALRRGYELWVHVKVVGGNKEDDKNRKKAEGKENELLEKYDYAWNKRSNGEIRNIHVLP